MWIYSAKSVSKVAFKERDIISRTKKLIKKHDLFLMIVSK
jgi:hypothetical protein